MAQQTIEISENAAKKIHDILLQQQREGHGLRVKVVGGGCSGLTYKMDIDTPRDGDRVFERDDAKVLVASKSFLSCRGTELDYPEPVVGAGFKLRIPNVKRWWGCGSSFWV